MKVTYQAPGYRPEDVTARYVRANGENYTWCEVGEDRRYDIRQGTAGAEEIPEEVRAAADRRAKVFPSYVRWPL